MSNNSKVAEADSLMKAANKLCTPSILSLRLKPDWDQACPLLERAGAAYKAGRAWARATEAFERAAQAQERLGSPWHAGKALELCASCEKENKSTRGVVSFSRLAAESFLEAGRPVAAAESLRKGGRLLEEMDQDACISLSMEAISVLEEQQHDKLSSAKNPEIYREVISLCIQYQKYDKAVNLLMRFGELCNATNAQSSLAKSYLGAIVVQLYTGDAKDAWCTYQDCLAIDNFMTCDAAHAADKLFTAYRSGSADEIKACIKGDNSFTYALDNAVARLAKRLPTGNLKKQVSELGAAGIPLADLDHSHNGPELDEDDLT